MTTLSCPLSGLRFFSRPRERQTSLGDEAYTAHTWQPTTTRPTSDTAQKVEAPAEDTFGSTQTHGEMLVVESFSRSSDCCLCVLVRMVVFVVVQVCGRPNQRTWSRARLCLRYQTCLCTVPLTKHKTLCSFDCSEISCTFVGCSFGSVCLTVGILSPVADGPLKQR